MANANVNVNTNNYIYGTLTCSSGTLNIDDSFIGDQIRTSIENGISRDEIFKAFDELFKNKMPGKQTARYFYLFDKLEFV